MAERPPRDQDQEPPTEREAIDPHPERDDRPEPRYESRRRDAIVVVIIGAIVLVIVVLHVAGGGFAPHGP